jgi:hypothetical protein
MASQYLGYCYTTLTEAANAYLAQGIFQVTTSGIVTPISITPVASSTTLATLIVRNKPISTATFTDYSTTVFFPTCTTPGAMPGVATDFITGLTTTLNTFFLFDAPLFDSIVGQVLAVMAVGLSTGIIVKLLKR